MKLHWIVPILITALALSACGSNATSTPISTIVVDGGNTNNTVKPVSGGGAVVASAVLVPAREADLAFVAGGNVKAVNVAVGEEVEAGQVLVELDNTAAQLEVDKAKRTLRESTSPAAIAAAEKAVANAQETFDDAKKKVNNIKLRRADNVTINYLQDQVTLAQDALDRARDAYKSTAGLSDLDPARAKAGTNLYNAQKAYNNAVSNLSWFTDPPSENDIALATADFELASAALQEAKWYLSELKGETIPPEATGAQLAQLQQARDNLLSAQDRLEQTRLLSPFSGIVAEVNVLAGEYASPGKILIVISDIAHLQVETTDLSERDIAKVKMGDPAVIMIEALNQEFSGKVANISPAADILGGDVVYKVTLTFDEQPQGALGGMTADVSIGKQE